MLLATAALLCVAPPLVNWLIMCKSRLALDSPVVMNRFGFIYLRYKPRFWFWESIFMSQELLLVAVEVFGRGMTVTNQARCVIGAAEITGICMIRAVAQF